MNQEELENLITNSKDPEDIKFLLGLHSQMFPQTKTPTKQEKAKSEFSNIPQALLTGAKEGFYGVGRTADTAGTILYQGLKSAVGLSTPEEDDKVFNAMNDRNKWSEFIANPDKVDTNNVPGYIGKAIGGAPGLLLSPASGVETSKDFLDKGESLNRARAAGVLNSAINTATLKLPLPAGNLPTRAITGAAAFSGIHMGSEAATRALAQEDATKEAHNPFNPEGLVQSATTGALFHGILGQKAKTKPQINPKTDQIITNIRKTEEAKKAAEQEQKAAIAEQTNPAAEAELSASMKAQAENRRINKIFASKAPKQAELFTKKEVGSKGANIGKASPVLQEPSLRETNPELFGEIPPVDTNGVGLYKDLPPSPGMDLPTQSFGDLLKAEQPIPSKRSPQIGFNFDKAPQDLPETLFTNKEGITSGELPKTSTSVQGEMFDTNPEHPYSPLGNEAYSDLVKDLPESYGRQNTLDFGVDGEGVIPMGESKAIPDVGSIDTSEMTSQSLPIMEERMKAYTENKLSEENGNQGDLFQEQPDLFNPLNTPKRVGTKEGGAVNFGVTDYLAKKLKLGQPKEKQAGITETDKREATANALTNIPGLNDKILSDALAEFVPIKTDPETIGAEVQRYGKDITRNQFDRITDQIRAGGTDLMFKYGAHPILRGARETIRSGQASGERFMKQYILGKDGLAEQLRKLSSEDKVLFAKLLNEYDRMQRFPEEGELASHGVPQPVIDAMNKHYEADRASLEATNQARIENGLPEISARGGHAPASFEIGFLQMVHEITASGDKKLAAIIATGSRQEAAKAVEYYKKNLPQAQISKIKAASDSTRFNDSQRIGDLMTIADLLKDLDPDNMGKALELAQQLEQAAVTSTTQHTKHALAKKGIEGSIGNKPWLSDKKNAEQYIDSLLRYYEDGAKWSGLVPEINKYIDTINNPEINQGHSNAVEVAKNYLNNAVGNNKNSIGKISDYIFDKVLLDAPHTFLRMNRGVSRNVGNKVFEQANKEVSQFLMGYGNIPFATTQFLQVLQTTPVVQALVSGRVGKSGLNEHQNMLLSVGNGGFRLLDAYMETRGLKHTADPFSREAFKYMVDNGITDINQLETIHSVTQSKFGQVKDQVAEYNVTRPEIVTRSYTFMMFADYLNRNGMSKDLVFKTAENLTNYAMIDYRGSERPMMYTQSGILGKAAGGLHTFSFGNLSQSLMAMREAYRNGNYRPLIASGISTVIFSGVTGMTGYKILDNVYNQAMGHEDGEDRHIATDLFSWISDKGGREAARYGVLSALTKKAWFNKFDNNIIDPNSLTSIVAPKVTAGVNAISGVVKGLANGTEEGAKRALYAGSPNSLKPYEEGAMFKGQINPQTGSPDFISPKDSSTNYHRTEEDWNARKGVFPVTSLSEALGKQRDYQNYSQRQAINAIQKDVVAKLQQAVNDSRGRGVDKETLNGIINTYISLHSGITKEDAANRITKLYENMLSTYGMTKEEKARGMGDTNSSIEKFMQEEEARK